MKRHASPVLVIGTQRSGSNLLRLMLNQLPEIEAPHPPHLLQIFARLVRYYGILEDERNFRMLIDDICHYIKANPVPWSHIELNGDKIANNCKTRSLTEIFKVVYETKAEYKNARYWCCKSMANVYFIPEIEENGMNPFYIHLIRDGRDVAASFKNAIVGEKHLYFIAKQWVKEQELALSMTSEYAEDRTVQLKYEDFINDPKQALLPILNKLKLDWTDDILKYYAGEEAHKTAAAGAMWKNVIKPVDKTNMRHYSEKISKEEIRLFETIAGKTLKYFGYEPDNDLNILKDEFSDEEIASFKKENEELKKEARIKYHHDAQVREKQENVLKEIKTRLGA